MERRNDILALSQSLGEAPDRYLCHREAQHLLAATAFMAGLDVLDVEKVVGSLKAPLQEAVRQIVAFRKISEEARAATNERFIADAADRYRDFFDRVESRPLTERQRRAALTGEDATLVLAGAGSGKTSVLMARAGFILESGLAGESEILVRAFARKAQQEMAERIKARLGRKIAVSTFHSLGLAILGEAEGRRPNLSKLAEDTRLFRKTIARFIDDAAADPAYRSSLVHFFATVLFVPKPQEAFASRDAYLQYVRSVELRTVHRMGKHAVSAAQACASPAQRCDGFLLVLVRRLIDCQFSLQCTRLRRIYGNPGEIVSKVR
jgi:DNA helicase-4